MGVRFGLSSMASSTPLAWAMRSNGIITSILSLENLFNRRPNAMLLQMFFDAKASEIVNLFSDGPEVDFDRTAEVLKKIAPFYLPQWKQIK